MKGERSSQTGFQPFFLLPQNYSPIELRKGLIILVAYIIREGQEGFDRHLIHLKLQ